MSCLEGNYSVLIIDGKASEQELLTAWLVILSEFHELHGDAFDQSGHFTLSRDMERIRHHLTLLQSCLDFLNEQYSDSIADSVRRMGYRFSPEDKDPDSYRHLLHRIVNKAKRKIIELEQLTIQFNKEMEGVQEIETPRAQFESMLLNFEAMQKTTYNLETLTVSKYIQLEKRYTQHIERMSAKKEAHGY